MLIFSLTTTTTTKKKQVWNCLDTLNSLYYWRVPLSTHLLSLYLQALFFISENLFLFMITCDTLFSYVIISENLFKPFLFVNIYFCLCLSVKISFIKYIFETSVLKCIFWGNNFELHSGSETHFLREQLFQFFHFRLLISVACCFMLSWLLISVAAVLRSLLKSSPQRKVLQYWHE